MAWSQTDLTALESAISAGALRVEYSGAGGSRTVTYHSLQEMLDLRRLMRTELGLEPAGGRRFFLSSYRKGTARDD